MNLEYFVNVQYCYAYLIDQIPVSLLLYSHIPTAISAILVSTLILVKVRSRASVMLLLTSVMFTLWSFGDLGSWFSFLGPGITMFLWSLLDILGILMFYFTYYFFYALVSNEKLPPWQVLSGFILIIPVIVYTFLGIHLPIYDANSCTAIENSTITKYPYFVEFLIIVSTVFFTRKRLGLATESDEKKKIKSAAIGVLIFLLFFFTATLTVSLLSDTDASSYVYNYLIYGLFGMPILLVYLGYLIVRFKAFNIKLAGAQALVFGVIALIGSEYFFVESKTNIILVSVTLILSCIGGYFLVRSVKREIAQREQLEVLTDRLAKANVRLKELDKLKSEFVSIASHQLRSPLTSMRGYASMLTDGSYGVIPEKAREAVQRIADSSALMARSVENYLNVSRIESGNMKYEMSDFNLKDEASKLVDDKRQEAMKKGLLLTFRSDVRGQGIVHGDIGKAVEIMHNLLNNSVKYTPKGTIEVYVHDDKKLGKIFVDIIDSGIGMKAEDIEHLFGKFSRATNANSVNVSGTGLGLYVARMMAVAMKGDIKAFSDGPEKGSTFRFELPEVM